MNMAQTSTLFHKDKPLTLPDSSIVMNVYHMSVFGVHACVYACVSLHLYKMLVRVEKAQQNSTKV